MWFALYKPWRSEVEYAVYKHIIASFHLLVNISTFSHFASFRQVRWTQNHVLWALEATNVAADHRTKILPVSFPVCILRSPWDSRDWQATGVKKWGKLRSRRVIIKNTLNWSLPFFSHEEGSVSSLDFWFWGSALFCCLCLHPLRWWRQFGALWIRCINLSPPPARPGLPLWGLPRSSITLIRRSQSFDGQHLPSSSILSAYVSSALRVKSSTKNLAS